MPVSPPLFIDLYRGDYVEDFSLTKAAGIVGVYHKVSEGASFLDSRYAPRRKMWMDGENATLHDGTKCSVVWGGYHFLHGNIDPRAEAHNFIAALQPDAETLAVLDWEKPPGLPVPTAAQARAFIEEAEARLGRKIAIYSGNAAKEQIQGYDEFFAARRLILAQYGTKWVVQESWVKPWGWQNNGDDMGPGPNRIPGIRGYCDNNTIVPDVGMPWDSAVARFLAEWRGVAVVAPSPPPAPPGPGAQWFSVVATEFGGPSERQQSAYTPFALIDPEKLIVALPYRFPGTRPQVDVQIDDGVIVTTEIGDIGPLTNNDPYWQGSGSPRRGRGIDMTPAVWDALKIATADPRRGLTTVKWRFNTSGMVMG